MENVEIDVAGVKTTTDFEVIEIMGDKDPYPDLLGIDSEYDKYDIIDINKDPGLITFTPTKWLLQQNGDTC
jgi:hypothetical protein